MDRVTQLEMALAAAREMMAEYQSRHEAAEKVWAAQFQRQQKRIEWLESCLVGQTIQQSRRAQ